MGRRRRWGQAEAAAAAMVTAAGGSWALQPLLLLLLSLCGLCLADQGNLPKPKNVQVHVMNTNFTLKWDWDGKCNVKDCNVTFSTYYHLVKKKHFRVWQKLSGCIDVAATMCDFSSAKLDFLRKYKLHVKAERGEDSSAWSNTVVFVPDEIAEIGPPSDVQVEAIDGLIRINILAPGSTDKTPMWEASDFSYLVELRKNGSNEQKQIKLASNNERIDKLSPNTTYCLRVKAQLNAGEKEGSFSPEYCVHTESADANVLPRPENVRIHALNTHFVLKWDWDEAYGENVTFLVECCRAYDKKYMASNCWHAVPSCKEVTTSECDLSSEIWFEGTYEFRVRAISGTEERAWSKEITCNPSKDTEIGPPSKVEINLINDSIEIKISHPGEDTNKSMKDIQGFYDLSYRIFVWKNTSDKWEKCFEDEHTLYTLPVSELNPETYCLKVQAFSQMSNKSGHFSAIKCITTEAGNNPVVLVVAVFFATLFVFSFIVAFCYGAYNLHRWIKYVFFPSCKLPSNIEECFHEVSLKSSFVSCAEEPTEKCSITMNIVAEDMDEISDKDFTKHCTQSSVDSGNYSNEDEVNEGASEET